MSELFDTIKPIIDANAFAVHNHIVVDDIRLDYAECHLDVVEESTNPYGAVHGGAYFTLADVCAGMTSRSDGRSYVTQQASAQFVRGCKSGRITARSRVVSRGRTVCLIDVEITDEAGALLFRGCFTFFCVSSKLESKNGK